MDGGTSVPDVPEGWTAGDVSVDGVELHYYRTGSGPPMVLAHGFTDDGRCWEPLAAELAADYDLVAYDARAHGHSDAPPDGYGIEDRVADLLGLVDELELQNPVLLGHSMGAATVTWAAAERPDLPRAVVLEDPAGLLPEVHDATPEERAADVRATLQEWEGQSSESIAAEHDDRDPVLARRLGTAKTLVRPEVAKIAERGYPHPGEAYDRIECPTLVLKADADPTERAEHLAVADRFDRGRLVHVPGAGHCVYRDRPKASLRELRAFLERV